MPSTLLLNPDTWDLMVDANGNIALAKEPYALAQDVASSGKLFQGELYYDTTQGVPYWQSILGKFPPLQLIKNAYVLAALTVPNIVAAICFITKIEDRALQGQIQSTDVNGNIISSRF